MKSTFLFSFFLHIFIIMAMFFMPTKKYRKIEPGSVYQVALVSMPMVSRQSVVNAPDPQAPAKKEAVPINKPEKTVHKPSPPAKSETPRQKAQEAIAGTGNINIDTNDFPFAYYLHILRHRIQENWEPPFQQSTASEKINAVVGFRVLRDGKIVDVTLEKSSGRFLYDQAAQRAVYLASPLPPLPDDFSDEQLTVHIEFEELW